MSVRLLYFAWVRERVGLPEEQVDLPETVVTLADLVGWLKSRGEGFAHAFENERVIRAAVDQVHARPDTAVTAAREIAFFPPMTGG